MSSTDEWINNILYVHTMQQYLAIKGVIRLTPATTWMGLENILLKENKTDRKDYILHDLACI